MNPRVWRFWWKDLSTQSDETTLKLLHAKYDVSRARKGDDEVLQVTERETGAVLAEFWDSGLSHLLRMRGLTDTTRNRALLYSLGRGWVTTAPRVRTASSV